MDNTLIEIDLVYFCKHQFKLKTMSVKAQTITTWRPCNYSVIDLRKSPSVAIRRDEIGSSLEHFVIGAATCYYHDRENDAVQWRMLLEASVTAALT